MLNYNDFTGPYTEMARKAAEPWLKVSEVAQKNAIRVSDLMLKNARKLAENANQALALLKNANCPETFVKDNIEYVSRVGTEALHQGQEMMEVVMNGAEEFRRVLMQEATEIAKHAQSKKN